MGEGWFVPRSPIVSMPKNNDAIDFFFFLLFQERIFFVHVLATAWKALSECKGKILKGGGSIWSAPF